MNRPSTSSRRHPGRCLRGSGGTLRARGARLRVCGGGSRGIRTGRGVRQPVRAGRARDGRAVVVVVRGAALVGAGCGLVADDDDAGAATVI